MYFMTRMSNWQSMMHIVAFIHVRDYKREIANFFRSIEFKLLICLIRPNTLADFNYIIEFSVTYETEILYVSFQASSRNIIGSLISDL